MSTEILARIQFAVTISFHYIYPPLSIGLGILLVSLEAMWLKTGKEVYHRAAKFWTKVFALTFAIGVATGIVMEFEFGTNWSTYSRYVGDVFGSALAAEGIFAFFLESGFLAVLLFGWDRVGKKMHFFSTLMVCFGAHFSAVWIVVANSWQQTPAGYHIVTDAAGNARAEITDFWAMVFNPSSVDRLSHTIIGCWQAGAWLMISVCAWYLLKGKHVDVAKASIRPALVLAMLASILQLITGHSSAEGVAENQPAKLAAMEAHYPASAPADMWLFGWVDDKNQDVKFGIKVPGMLSWLIHGNASKSVTGLEAFAKEDRPPINFTFQMYHLMVAIGFALIGLSYLAGFLWWRGKLFENRVVLWLMVLGVLGPQIANQVGWFAAEVGRQPWIVYNLLRTSDGLSKVVTANHIITSLIMFTIVYVGLFAVFIYLLNEKIQHGPDAAPVESAQRKIVAEHLSHGDAEAKA